MEQPFSNPLDPSFFPGAVLVLVLAWVLFSVWQPPSGFWRRLHGHLDQLGNELDRRFDRERWLRRVPVFSAETIQGKEAAFIRERLPRKAPRARFVLLLLIVGALLWWLTR